MSHQTITTVPDANMATFNVNNKSFLRTEIPGAFYRHMIGDFVHSGGIHATVAGMISPSFATEAYTDIGNRVTANGTSGAVSIDYSSMGASGNDVVWVIISDRDENVLDNFSRVGSSNYFVDVFTATKPPLPLNCAWLMKVTIASSNITGVVDLRRPVSLARYGAYDPKDHLYGAVGDGIVDDTIALQECIDAAGEASGMMSWPCGIYKISETLTIPYSNLSILGDATSYMFQTSQPQRGTYVVWAGAAGGHMINMGPPPSGGALVVYGNRFEDITLDGKFIGGIGLVTSSVLNCAFRNIVITGATLRGLLVTVSFVAAVGFSVTDHCEFSNVNIIGIGDSHGITITGATPDGYGSAFCQFLNCSVTHANGIAYGIFQGDDNYFINCSASRLAGGTGDAIFFGGSNDGSGRFACANMFLGFNGQGGIRSQGDAGWTSPALANFVLITGMDTPMAITIDGGSSMYFLDVGGYSVGSNARMRLPGIEGAEADVIPDLRTSIKLLSGTDNGSPFISVVGGSGVHTVEFASPPQLPFYLLSTLPTLTAGDVGALGYCGDLTGGAEPVFWDGAGAWRRMSTRVVAN